MSLRVRRLFQWLIIAGWLLELAMPVVGEPVQASGAVPDRNIGSSFVQASVWAQTPRVPVLTYHQFINDSGQAKPWYPSHALKINLSDFRAELQALYDSGYSLISLEDWLAGNVSAPEGRRPLIITLDDLFFNNQFLLLENGEPDPHTGIGVLWYFYQEHPEFGFKLALFATLGDKLYASPDDPGWQDDLGRAIAWCIDHGAGVYNHFYTHPRLDKTELRYITVDARKNDDYLRKLLIRVQREDLLPKLGNIIALPYGLWPATQRGKNALMAYQTPEGKPLSGILEIDFIVRPKFLLPVISRRFNRWHIPRIVADRNAINYLVEHQEEFPIAHSCLLPKQADMTVAVARAIQLEQCPPGIYYVNGMVIDATADMKLSP